MRLVLPLVLLVLAGPALAAPAGASRAAVSWRPRAWQPPVAATGALRFDPESGAGRELPEVAAEAAQRRAALASVPVRRHADGSRSAVIGGLARRYTVARIGDDGALHESCVTSEAEARKLVAPPAREGR